MPLEQYRVSYIIDVEATDMAAAAEQVAAMLSDPAVPARGVYHVENVRTGAEDDIDLDEEVNGGSNYFG